MTNYGRVKSTVRPELKVIDPYSVWISLDITEITETDLETETEISGYEYSLVQYSKDEYISMIDDRNSELEEQLTDTQLALCDVYEMIGG